jgi:hypothetical protein
VSPGQLLTLGPLLWLLIHISGTIYSYQVLLLNDKLIYLKYFMLMMPELPVSS